MELGYNISLISFNNSKYSSKYIANQKGGANNNIVPYGEDNFFLSLPIEILDKILDLLNDFDHYNTMPRVSQLFRHNIFNERVLVKINFSEILRHIDLTDVAQEFELAGAYSDMSEFEKILEAERNLITRKMGYFFKKFDPDIIKKIQDINLSNLNSFNPEIFNICKIPTHTVTKLNLGNIQLIDDNFIVNLFGKTIIGETVQLTPIYFPNLVSLKLSRCEITHVSITSILAHDRCKKLKELNVSYTNIGTKGVCEIFDKCTVLEYLNISGINIDYFTHFNINPENLKKVLIEIELGDFLSKDMNYVDENEQIEFKTTLKKQLFEKLAEFEKLERINLSNNKSYHYEDTFQCNPITMFDLDKLKKIYDKITHLRLCGSFDFSNNDNNFPFPNYFIKFKNLKVLELSYDYEQLFYFTIGDYELPILSKLESFTLNLNEKISLTDFGIESNDIKKLFKFIFELGERQNVKKIVLDRHLDFLIDIGEEGDDPRTNITNYVKFFKNTEYISLKYNIIDLKKLNQIFSNMDGELKLKEIIFEYIYDSENKEIIKKPEFEVFVGELKKILTNKKIICDFYIVFERDKYILKISKL